MGKCVLCGKSGLFLKVDKEGRCKECANAETKKREDGIAAAKAFLAPISAAFSDIFGNGAKLPGLSSTYLDVVDVPRESVSRLREECSFICSELPKWSDFPYFEEAFKSECFSSGGPLRRLEHPSIKIGPISETSSPVDFSRFFPDLLKKVSSLNFALSRWGEYEFMTIRVAGVTFKNEDGVKRQEILKKIRYHGAPYRTDPDISLKRYEYDGEDAVAVYANEEQIGNLSRLDVSRVLPRWSRFNGVDSFSIHGDGSSSNKFGIDIVLRFYKP